MKFLHIILFVFIVLALSLSCEKEEVERPFARMQTLPVTEIDSTGATFHAEILSFHKDDITEYGFMWYNGILNRVWDTPDRFSHIALGTAPTEKRFSARIATGFVPGETYQVRAYLRSTDWVIYGEPVVFTSKGGQQPVIDKISPDIVVPGDTLLISGKYFASRSNDLTVTIGGTTAEIIASDLNQIKCMVPRYVNDNATIQVRTQSNKAPATVQMPTIAKPEIYSLSASEVAVGDTLTLKGKYFSPQKDWNEIKTNNGGNFQIIRYFPDSLQFVVSTLSAVAGDYQLFVEVGVRRSENQATFTMAAPIIEDFFPKTGGYGDTITFVGDKFHPDAQSNMVRFAEFGYFRILESNRRSLKVFMREIPLGTHTERSAPFSISIANQTTVTSESFKYVNRDWSFISDIPGGQNHNPPGFTIQNTLYLNTGQPGEWWSYNTQSRNWRLQSRTPAGDGNFLTKEALTIENEGFIIQRKENSNDSLFFWRFRPSTDQWTRATALSIPAEARELDSYAAFAIEQNIFICFSGLENNCWTYDLSSNQWTSFRSFSNFFSSNNFYKIVPLAGASVDQKGYIVAQQGNTRYLLEYDPAANIWRKVSDYPENPFPNNTSSFSFQGKVFFLSLIPVYNEAFEWNPSNQISRRWLLPTPPTNISVSGGQALTLTDRVYFAIGGKLYEWFPR